MLRTILLLLFGLFFSSIATAEDLRLRITTSGHEEAIEAPRNPQQTILRSIETQIAPGQKFSAACIYGAERMELSGSAKQDENSKFRITLHYKYTKIPAEVMAAIRLNERPLPDNLPGSSIQTMITLKPGESFTMGGATSVVTDKLQDAEVFSANQIVATLIDLDTTTKK